MCWSRCILGYHYLLSGSNDVKLSADGKSGPDGIWAHRIKGSSVLSKGILAVFFQRRWSLIILVTKLDANMARKKSMTLLCWL